MRLDLRDVRLNRDAECEKHKRPEDMKVHELMRDAEAVGGNVAEDLLVNEDSIVDAETVEQESSDANREDANEERDEGKRKMDGGEEKRSQDDKRRRLQLLASGKKLLNKFPEGCFHGPSKTRPESHSQRFGIRTNNERRLHD